MIEHLDMEELALTALASRGSYFTQVLLTPVPEPASILILGVGIGFALLRRRRAKAVFYLTGAPLQRFSILRHSNSPTPRQMSQPKVPVVFTSLQSPANLPQPLGDTCVRSPLGLRTPVLCKLAMKPN